MKSSWKRWKDLKVDDRIELLRSELHLTTGINNMLFFALVILVAVVGPYTKLTIWVPLVFFLITAAQSIERWKKNSKIVDELRGYSLAGVVAEQADRKKAKGA